MMTRLPQAVWKYFSITVPDGGGADRRAAGRREVDAVVQRAVAVDRVGAPAERRGDRTLHGVVEEAVGPDRAVVAEEVAGGLAGAARGGEGTATRLLGPLAEDLLDPVALLLQALELGHVGPRGPCRPPPGPRRGGRPGSTPAARRPWPAPRAPACFLRFSAAALRSVATSALAFSTSCSCTVSSARDASSRSRMTDSLSSTFCDGVELAGQLGRVLRGQHHRETHQRRVAGLVVLHDDLAERLLLVDDLLPAGGEVRHGRP